MIRPDGFAIHHLSRLDSNGGVAVVLKKCFKVEYSCDRLVMFLSNIWSCNLNEIILLCV